ncbi:MAG: TetR/AcrR family transcriptional regulator [Parvibaculum sp.]|nr:TetR/AcrR family transcriptional regulator [Parvibaculum sp.]
MLTLSRHWGKLTCVRKKREKSASSGDAAVKKYHHGDLKSALVAAGTRILEEDGVMALSLRGAARAAGVSQTAPYHHFADKEALLAAIAATGFEDLSAEMARRAAGVSTAQDRLSALGLGYVMFATANPGRFRLMFGPLVGEKTQYPALLEAATLSYRMIHGAVAAYLDASATPNRNVDANSMAAWSLVHGLATLINDGGFHADVMGAATLEELTALVTGFLRKGLGQKP